MDVRLMYGRHANHALTDDQVRELRRRYAEGQRYPQRHPDHVTMRDLGAEFGIGKTAAWKAVTRQTYEWVR